MFHDGDPASGVINHVQSASFVQCSITCGFFSLALVWFTLIRFQSSTGFTSLMSYSDLCLGVTAVTWLLRCTTWILLAGSQVLALSMWHMSPLPRLPGGRAAAMQSAAGGHAAARPPSCKWAATFQRASTSGSKMSSADCSQRLSYSHDDTCMQAVAPDSTPDLTPFLTSDYFTPDFLFSFIMSPNFTFIFTNFAFLLPLMFKILFLSLMSPLISLFISESEARDKKPNITVTIWQVASWGTLTFSVFFLFKGPILVLSNGHRVY